MRAPDSAALAGVGEGTLLAVACVEMNAASERHEIPTENLGSEPGKQLTVNLRKVRIEVVQGPDRGAVVELGDKAL